MEQITDYGALLWLIHVCATWYMTGLIWFVQLSHYPLMDRVARDGYAAYQLTYMRRTAWAVGPAMLAEAFAGVLLLYARPAFFSFTYATVNVALLLGIWISTAVLQVPCHAKLERGFDAAAHRRLVRTNWIRTVLWSLRAVGLAACWSIV
jgi:uncharacterized membrane protein